MILRLHKAPGVVPRIVVFLHRRKAGTIWTSYTPSEDHHRPRDSGLIGSRNVRSLDVAKQRINARLERYCKEVVYVDPPGENGRAPEDKE